MNLMFWKKKADTGGDAEALQENSADETVAHESPETGSLGAESSDSESTKKPGLAARIKSLLAVLIRRFKKPPTFQAEEGQATGAPENPESISEDTSPAGPVNLKKRLIIGGAISLLVLLLAWTGLAVRKIFLSTPEEDIDTSVTVETPHTAQSAPPAVIPLAEIEALKKKNDELKAQIEALKKEPPQPDAPMAPQASENILPSPDNGSLTVDNKNPKATAMSLKEAIDAMNAGSGDFQKNPAK